jgi:hypothetical protein
MCTDVISLTGGGKRRRVIFAKKKVNLLKGEALCLVALIMIRWIIRWKTLLKS